VASQGLARRLEALAIALIEMGEKLRIRLGTNRNCPLVIAPGPTETGERNRFEHCRGRGPFALEASTSPPRLAQIPGRLQQ
jgi:hypothetical protein